MMSSTDEEDVPADWRTDFDYPTASSSSSGFPGSDDYFLAGCSPGESASFSWGLPRVEAEEPNQSASATTPLKATPAWATVPLTEPEAPHFDYSSDESTHRSIFGSNNPNALPVSPIKSRTKPSRSTSSQRVISTEPNISEVTIILNKGEKVLPHIGLLMGMVRRFEGIPLNVYQYMDSAVSREYLTYADSKVVTEFLLNSAVTNAYQEYINTNYSGNISALSSVAEGGCQPPSLLTFFSRVFHRDDGKEQAQNFCSEYKSQATFQSKLQCLIQHLIFGEGGHLDTSFKTLLLKHLDKEFELNVKEHKKSIKLEKVAQALAAFGIKKSECRERMEFGF